MNILKRLFGFGAKTDFAQLVAEGAIIIDVRSQGEFGGGHIKGAINIPLGNLTQHLSRLKKDKPIITCCASGMRSASARNILSSNGFTKVYNGGGWYGLQGKIGR